MMTPYSVEGREGQNGYITLQCWVIGPIQRRIVEKTTPFGERKVLFHPDNSPNKSNMDTAAPSTTFSALSSLLARGVVHWIIRAC